MFAAKASLSDPCSLSSSSNRRFECNAIRESFHCIPDPGAISPRDCGHLYDHLDGHRQSESFPS